MALPTVMASLIIGMCVGIPITFFDNLFIVSSLLWVYFFISYSVIPITIGYMISTVEPELRT